VAKTITRSDVIEIAQTHGWSWATSAMSGEVGLKPLRDVFTREDWTLSVGWNDTPFNSEPRFGYALLEGGDRPAGVPNISGIGGRGAGACVVGALSGEWRP